MPRLTLGAVAAALLAGGTAQALRFEFDGQPLVLDFTETADVAYHLDNGVIAPVGSPGYDPTSDNYVDYLNRFDAQLSYGRWHAEARFDSALFFNTPTVRGPFPDPSQCNGTNNFRGGCENRHLATLLENRYTDNFEAEKLSVNYLGDHLDATLGDFYLSYGRGLVISILKLDALGVDTTIRGANVTARYGGFTANVAGGLTNVVNTDEPTGEVAPDPNDRVVAGRLEYRVPRLFTLGIDGAGFFQNPATAGLSSYAPGVPTVQVPLGLLALGSITSQLPQAAPGLADTGNFSVTLDLPHLGDVAKLYLEAAHQLQSIGASTTQGNAFLGSLSVFLGRATLLVEAKDYRNFYSPIPTSLSSQMFPAFWQQNVYTNAPTLEEIFQEEALTYDIEGPRARLDFKVNDRFTPFVSVAYFIDQYNEIDIYDGFVGADVNWQDHQSHAQVSAGRRYEIYNQLFGDPGQPFQREWWVQYDAVQVLGPIYSLELEGLHRRYDFDSLVGHPWTWGYSYLSLKRRAWTGSLGYEYDTEFPDFLRPQNPNAALSWHLGDRYTVSAFGGGREGGLRCINGICRNFPGFTGASLEFVARY